MPFQNLWISLAEAQKGFDAPEIIRCLFIEACHRAIEKGKEVIPPGCA